jgi:hypothetical protein
LQRHPFHYVATGGEVEGDIIRLAKLPRGSRVADYFVALGDDGYVGFYLGVTGAC